MQLIGHSCDEILIFKISNKKRPFLLLKKKWAHVKTTKDLKYQMFLHSVILILINLPNG
ncbi:hypothetical protein J809_2646 [Acinetobacter sp. 25977_6]|nr:hypothetical protein J525_1738 [Acinetobacter sp. 21871]EXI11179.1 hypothetical protein J604_2511 [Acinetobacter sp. 694762]EXR65179.1 hypothetical protein J678_1003 [Acinetobacter sp. 1424608]EXT38640.1 hypothetical protein J811_1900 [Acinetobacter sp. 25977_8]EXT42671.1 hypothetical protein J810_2737 [Acinetobacter sp. 25977_7]EXT43638.1 hypothetical protein J809_2646 [Acinetobacter sp. 25977_6]EXT49742.1 hypothetical protein J807_2694 [Acinetobacter sp. 25977_4]EXT55955.1 hypothetical 